MQGNQGLRMMHTLRTGLARPLSAFIAVMQGHTVYITVICIYITTSRIFAYSLLGVVVTCLLSQVLTCIFGTSAEQLWGLSKSIGLVSTCCCFFKLL